MLLASFAVGCGLTYFIMRGLLNKAKEKFFELQDQFEKEEHEWQAKLDTEHSAYEKAVKERDQYLREKEDLVAAQGVLPSPGDNMVPATELDALKSELERISGEREELRRCRDEVSAELERTLAQGEGTSSGKLTDVTVTNIGVSPLVPPKPTMTPEMILLAQQKDAMAHTGSFDWQRLEASLTPIVERLAEFDRKITKVENSAHQFGDIGHELTTLMNAQKKSSIERSSTEGSPSRTATLHSHAPISASRWLEKFGLNKGKDFFEQAPQTSTSRTKDIFIRLPDEKFIYVDCHSVTHESLVTLSQKHSDLATMCEALSKNVQERKRLLSDAVVDEEIAACDIKLILLPTEEAYLELTYQHSALLDSPEGHRVFVVSPVHLSFVCNFLSFVSRQIESHSDIEKILKLGRDLGLRVGKIIEAVDAVGSGLNQTVVSFNELMRSVDFHLISNLRKIDKMHTFDWPSPKSLSEDLIAAPVSSRNGGGDRKPA